MNCALFCLAAHSFSWLSPKVALHRKLVHWTQVGRRMCAKSKKKTVKETAPWRLIIYPRKPLGWKCLKGNKQGRLFYQNNRPLVRVERFERSAPWTQITCATNCATPGYSFFCHYTTASGKNKDFSVCGHLCGQSRFCAAFGNRGKSRKRRCRKALRRFVLPCPGYRHGTPKPGAIPTSLYPDTTHYYSRSKCVCPVLYIAFMESCVLIHHWLLLTQIKSSM